MHQAQERHRQLRQAILDSKHVADGCRHQQRDHRADFAVQTRQDGHQLRVKAQHAGKFGEDQKAGRDQQARQDAKQPFAYGTQRFGTGQGRQPLGKEKFEQRLRHDISLCPSRCAPSSRVVDNA